MSVGGPYAEPKVLGKRDKSAKETLSKRLARRFSGGTNRVPPTLALICVVLLAAWMGDAEGGYFVGEWGPSAFVLAALVLFVSAVGFFRSTKLRWAILALGLLAAYAAWTSASLLWSPNKGDAWLGAGQTLLYLLVFWVAVALVALGASRRWVLTASVVGPAVIAALTLATLGSRLDELFANSRLTGTVGYYNGEAAFLLVPFWVAIYLGGSKSLNPALRGVVLAGATLCAELAVLTQSRGAMVALALSLIVFFLLSGQRLRGLLALAPVAAALVVTFPRLNAVYLRFLDGGDPAGVLNQVSSSVWLTAAGAGMYGLAWGLMDRRWRLPTGVTRIAGGVALAGVLVVFGAGGAVLNERTDGAPVAAVQQKWEAFKSDDTSGQESSRYLSASGSGRYALWQVAWEDFERHPVLGVGTQNYEATYYQLREAQIGSVRQPHMLPLEILGERGLVGGVLFFGFLAVCLGVSLSSRFRDLRSEGKAQVGALVAAVAYWFVHSGADWFWQLPAVTLPAFVYLALLVSPWRVGRMGTTSPAFPGWPLRACGMIIAVVTVCIVAPLFVANQYLQDSYSAGDPKKALVAVERAQQFNPLNSGLPQREAELAMEIGDWKRTENAYERAIQLNPEHYEPYMLLATFYERRGQFDEACDYYEKALTRNPRDEDLARSVDRLSET